MSDNKWDEFFYYDETSPSCLRWRKGILSGKDMKICLNPEGSVAGTLRKSGYFSVKLHSKFYQVHKVIWELLKGEVKEGIVDHKDGNSSNNKITNLRNISLKVNSHNMKIFRNNKTGITGVSFNTSRYIASYRKDGRNVQKSFSIKRYGELAIVLAEEWRRLRIEEENLLGEGYTERHGK